MSIIVLLFICCGYVASWVKSFSALRALGNPKQILQGLRSGTRANYLQLGTRGDNVACVGFGATSSVESAIDPGLFALQLAIETLILGLPTKTATFPVLKHYVNRPSLEDSILQVYESQENDIGSYTVIVGSNGAGTSSVVAHVLSNKPGVLRLTVTAEDTEDSIVRKLMLTGGVRPPKISNLELRDLYPAFVQAAENANGRWITVVLEVELGIKSDEVLYMVKMAAKELALSTNVIIVLPEANTVLAFGDDKRQKFIWVDGMTHEEATVYAKKVFPSVADRDLMLFFDKVGLFTVYRLFIQTVLHVIILTCLSNYSFL